MTDDKNTVKFMLGGKERELRFASDFAQTLRDVSPVDYLNSPENQGNETFHAAAMAAGRAMQSRVRECSTCGMPAGLGVIVSDADHGPIYSMLCDPCYLVATARH